MKSTPPDWPRISSAIFYDDPAKAIDWLCKAFGFEVRIKVEGEPGQILHSELVYGEGLVMVGDAAKRDNPDESYRKSPRSIGGGNTQALMVYVDDVDAHCKRARSAGATIVTEPKNTDYGDEYWEDRGYQCIDPEGHRWWFSQRMRNPKGKASS
jgi:uncharacterized glyoxalase superfamily protein PhnB